jgi:hypothetical protein
MSFIKRLGAYPIGGKAGAGLGLGTTFYVSSVYGADSNPGTSDKPLATLVKALSKLAQADVSRNQGDTVILMQDHTESIDSATELAITRAGVSIIGVGRGTHRPRLQLSTPTTSVIGVSAANVLIENVEIQANVANLAVGIQLAATDLTLKGVYFTEATSCNFITIINAASTTDQTNNNLQLIDCVVRCASTSTRQLFLTAADVSGLRVENCDIVVGANASYSLIQAATGKDFFNIAVINNRIQKNNTDIDTVPAFINSDTTANTGIVSDNRLMHLDTATTLGGLDVTGAGLFENYTCGVVDESGVLIPAAFNPA